MLKSGFPNISILYTLYMENFKAYNKAFFEHTVANLWKSLHNITASTSYSILLSTLYYSSMVHWRAILYQQYQADYSRSTSNKMLDAVIDRITTMLVGTGQAQPTLPFANQSM